MTTGPEDRMAAAGRGRLRASHADREHVIGELKAAFVQGRLTKDELDARVGQTFASRTYAELAALTADIPAGLAGTQPRRPARAQSRPSMIKVVMRNTCMIIAAELLLILMVATVLPGPPGWAMAVFANLVGLPLAGGQILDTWRENRSRGQLPPGRAQRGQPLKIDQDGSPGDDLTRCQARSDVYAPRGPGMKGIQRAPGGLGVPGQWRLYAVTSS